MSQYTGTKTTTTEHIKSSSQTRSSRVSIRQNLSDESENQINQLINLFWQSDYICHSMAFYFDRADIGLYGLARLYRKCSHYTFKMTKELMDYLVVRGGRVVFDEIKKPERQEWGQPLEALQTLLNVKKSLYDAALNVHNTAEKSQDAHLDDFIEEEYIRPLSLAVRRIGVLISNLETATGTNQTLGVYQFNKHLYTNMDLFFEKNKDITHYLKF